MMPLLQATRDSIKKAGWEGILLGAAAVFFAARYGAAFFLMLLCSDYLTASTLFRDIFVHGHSLRDWAWGTNPFTFPDLAVVFSLNGLLKDGIATLQVYTSLLFLGLYVSVVLIYRECGGRHVAAFSGLLLALFIGIITNFGLRTGFHAIAFFTPFTHSGACLSSLLCLYFLLRFLRRHSLPSLWFLGAVLFLTGISDASSLLVFSLPCAVALAAASFWYPERARTLRLLAAAVFCGAVAAYLLCPLFFPAPIERGGYTHPQVALLLPTLRDLGNLLRPSHGLLFPAFFLLNSLLVLGAGALAAGLFRSRVGRLPLGPFLLLIFTAAMILINWGAVIATGNLTLSAPNPFGDVRYYVFTIVAPLFLLAGGAAHVIPWSRTGTGILAVAVSALAGGVALFCLPQPSSEYREAKRLIPVLHEIMAGEGVRNGLADYWHAVLPTYLSDDSVVLRPIFSGGIYLASENNVKWYAGDTPEQPPDFNLLLTKDLNPDDLRRRYGAPTKIVSLGEDGEAWLYLGDDAIRYSDFARDLLPKKSLSGSTITWKPDALSSQTGTMENDSIIAAEGWNKAGYLLFGPYAHLRKGTYRIDLAYAYPVPPPAGKEAGIDIVGDNVKPRFVPLRILDQGKLPAEGDSGPPFSRTLSIPDGLRIQVRIFYPGAGALRVDSLKITHVGP